MNGDLTAVHGYKILANHQAHSNSVMVHLSCPLQFSKKSEEVTHLLRSDTLSSIDYVDAEHLKLHIICYKYAHRALPRKLKGILDEVY